MGKAKKLLHLMDYVDKGNVTPKRQVTTETLTEVYQKFKRHNTVKNLAEATVKYYDICFDFFIRFYTTKEDEDRTINEAIIEDYVIYLRTETPSNEVSIQSYLRGIRAFLYFGMKNGYFDKFTVSIPKAQEPSKETYSDEELTVLLKKPKVKETTFADFRNWAIINFLLGTGCRASTLCAVRIKDVDFDGGFITFNKTKNKRASIVPLSQELSKVIVEYFKYYNGEPDDYLFPSIFGEPMNKDTLRSAIVRYNNGRGIARTSIHAFRHTFAKHFVINGGNIFVLQKLLGHSSLEMVKNYVNLYGQDLKNGYDRFNPLTKFADTKGSRIKLNR